MVSVDFELAWGWATKGSLHRWESRFLRGRDAVSRLLDLLEAHEVPATWATVGHLFLEACRGANGVPHPEIVRPGFPWLRGDWFAHDPMGDARSHPLWYAPDLIDDILSRSPAHEIGSHTFAHLPFGEDGCTRRAADSDLSAAVSAARSRELRQRAFVFPRHSIGFPDLLASHGFATFRGSAHEPFLGLPSYIRKPLRLTARSLGAGVRPQTARLTEDGLVDVPASMFFSLPEGRAGRSITASSLVRACRGGIRRAVETGSVFQIYFHDHNMGVRTEEFFEALGSVLTLADRAREQGGLDVVTMGDYAESVAPQLVHARQARLVSTEMPLDGARRAKPIGRGPR